MNESSHPIPTESFDAAAYIQTQLIGISLCIGLTAFLLYYFRSPLRNFSERIPFKAALLIFIIFGDMGYNQLRLMLRKLLPEPNFNTIAYYSVFSMTGICYVMFAIYMTNLSRRNIQNERHALYAKCFICLYPFICIFSFLYVGAPSPFADPVYFVKMLWLRMQISFALT